MTAPPDKKPVRYEIAASTIRVDRAMQQFIKVGGISIVTAVFAIFIFILWQILPLFAAPKVEEDAAWSVPPGPHAAMGVDEWSALAFFLDREGELTFFRIENGAIHRQRLPLPDGERMTASRYHPKRQDIIVGTDQGKVLFVHLNYRASFLDGARRVEADVDASPALLVGAPGHAVLDVDMDGAGGQKIAAVIQDIDGRRTLTAALVSQRRTLIGGGAWRVTKQIDLTEQLAEPPRKALLNERADSVLVLTAGSKIQYFLRTGDELNLVQTFEPFPPESGEILADAEYLFGDDSLVCWSERGANVIFSLFNQPGKGRIFGKTKTFPALEGGVTGYAKSVRNKAFLLTGPKRASLRFATTEAIRWEHDVPYALQGGFIGPKYDSVWLLDVANRLHRLAVHDPHPESSIRAFFGKIWYEGAAEPKYEWQSTGGADEFEPKLSMVPLLIGTLKGTLYAMLFSVPLALLAALYTSQFAHPNFKRFVKPIMEIMASLPSVILGFLAALWLAPLVEQRVPSFMLLILALPLSSVVFGALWNRMPYSIRKHIRQGYEFIFIVPLLAIAAYAAWKLGPLIESMFFVARDLSTGQPVADFRLWWVQTTGLPFEQRNSLVVGLMMGFAVIPIIFTIAEDSLSNVPPSFRSASLALGASRWQTAIRVILPTASAGIFSAIMIGFGRAVGETMIVLMATGNTPIMDFNIFSGMRTLSANIAVELPEAPHHSTLYRALFLGAMLLFLMTFFVNTLAELLRHHLREKYKAI